FSPGDLSLREAVYLANSGIGGGVVNFSSSLTSTEPVTLTLSTITAAGKTTPGSYSFGPTGLALSGNVALQRPTGARGISISQNSTDGMRLFGVFAGANLTVEALTLTGGKAQGGAGGNATGGSAGGGGGGAGLGGAIFNNGSVNLIAMTFNGNTALGG